MPSAPSDNRANCRAVVAGALQLPVFVQTPSAAAPHFSRMLPHSVRWANRGEWISKSPKVDQLEAVAKGYSRLSGLAVGSSLEAGSGAFAQSDRLRNRDLLCDSLDALASKHWDPTR
jgi:hypothetical protein